MYFSLKRADLKNPIENNSSWIRDELAIQGNISIASKEQYVARNKFVQSLNSIHAPRKRLQMPPNTYTLLFVHHNSQLLFAFWSSNLGLLFRRLLHSCNNAFSTNTTKHKSHTGPLLETKRVTEPDDRKYHGQHFAGNGHGD